MEAESWSIEERAPGFHRVIRACYDRFGIPLYRLIRNAWLCDIIYVLMKPLEYAFLLSLYCFDTLPERRIERQYTDSLRPE